MLNYLVLVVLMKRSEWADDLVMIEQLNGGAGIFGENEIDRFQNFKGTEGYVLEIADGGGNDVEHVIEWRIDE